MKPKDWLLANGHISEVKRGRMSRDHITLIEQAVRDGANIEGYAVSKATPKNETEKSTPAVSRVSSSSDRIADVPDEIRPEESWQAHTFDNGSKIVVGMRTVCNGCSNSLTYCYCTTPRVWLDHIREGVVSFSGRTVPVSSRRW